MTSGADLTRNSDGISPSASCPPRGGPSPAGATYEVASEVEFELVRMRPPVSTDVLPAAEPGPPISVNEHAVRLCRSHGGLLLDQTGDIPVTPAQLPALGASESGGNAGDQEVPVRAQLLRLIDPAAPAKLEVAAIPNTSFDNPVDRIGPNSYPADVTAASSGWGGPLVRASGVGAMPAPVTPRAPLPSGTGCGAFSAESELLELLFDVALAKAEGRLIGPLRAARIHFPAVLQAPANEPASAVMPGQASPAPASSDFSRDQFLKEARAL